MNKYRVNILGEFDRLFSSKHEHLGTPRQALEQWVSELKTVPSINGKVLITALRNYTWIEWAVYCAAVIRKMGFESTLLYKGSEITKLYTELSYFNFWSGVIKIPGIILVDIEQLSYDEALRSKYFDRCHQSSIAALAYDHHIESADILDEKEKYDYELFALKKESAINGARIFKYLQEYKFHQFVCYSGLIRDTAMILQGALDANQETVCVEGWAWRPGHLIYNFNAPALEYNINGWMKYFGPWNRQKNDEINKYLNFLDGTKQDDDWLNNFYMVQRAKVSEEMPLYIKNFLEGKEKIFLLACNVIGDSSMLNRETIFRSQRDFVRQTIEYFSTRKDLKLIIRVHPAEEWVKGKVAIKMGEFSRKLAAGKNNILIIDSSEKVNTFSLIPFLHTGLVWLSSVGVDMVLRGVPVISAALPKYSGLGIVDEPKTTIEYFELIDKYSKSQLRPSERQKLTAKQYLYMVFKGFSFEAQGRTFRANSCRLGAMPSQSDHDRFYRILLKIEPSPDRIDNKRFTN